MASRKLIVEIVGDASSLHRSLGRVHDDTRKLSVGFGTLAKSAAVLGGITAAAAGVGAAFRAGVNEFTESAKVAAQTAAVIKSTGGIANVTAKQVDDLASAVLHYSGIDDEAVKSGENLLLTFKNVRNEVGKGNNVFDRATKAAVDLSVAGFGSITDTAKQLGKALNDPVRGMTALRRSGVTFTKAQEDQIKALVKANRTLDAQKLILREVESQVGGSAKALGDTLPGQLSKLREAFRNAAGAAVGAVAGPLSTAVGAFANFVPQIERSVARLSDAVGPALQRFVQGFTDQLPQIRRVAASFLDPLRDHVVPILRDVARIASQFWNAVLRVFDDNSQEIKQILNNLGAVLENVWAIAKPTIVFLFTKALPAALRVAIPVIEKVTGIVRVLSDVFVKTVSVILRAIDRFLGGLSFLSDALSHIPKIGDKFKGVSDRINEARDGLRGFADGLDAIDGRQVNVSINVDTNLGRPEEGGVGRLTTRSKTAGKIVAAISQTTAFFKQQIEAAQKNAAAARTVVKATDAATKATKDAGDAEKKRADEVDRLAEARRKAAARLQAAQFRALGLTATGDERAPGVANLKKQLSQLTRRLGPDISSNLKGQLSRIRTVLSGAFGAVTVDTRDKIKELFQTIRSGLSDGGKTLEHTATRAINRNAILKGLGLDPETEAIIKRRLQGFNTAGLALQKPHGAVGAFGIVVAPVNVTTEVVLDGQKVGRSVTKHQQARSRSNPRQKRGPLAGL